LFNKASFISLRSSRRFSFWAGAVAILLFLTVNSYGQSNLKIYGQVFNQAGPVADAQVVLLHTPYRALTDVLGHYYFYDIPAGVYSVVCNWQDISVKLAENFEIADGQPVQKDIFIDRDVISVAPIIVEARRDFPEARGVKVIVVDSLLGPRSISELVRDIPGLNILASGSGEIFASGGGVRPDAIEVLLDGRKINSLLTGKADLSQIPINAVKEVEYYDFGNADHGVDGGLCGALNFVTMGKKQGSVLELGAGRGSFGRRNYMIQAGYEDTRVGDIQIDLETASSINDFTYEDYFGKTQIRQNADARSQKYNLAYSNDLKGTEINISGNYYRGENGVPGKTISPSLDARLDKESFSIGGEARRLAGKRMRTGLLLSYSKRVNRYRDLIGAVDYKTAYYESQKSIDLIGEYLVARYANLRGGIGYEGNGLDGHDDLRPQYALGRANRDLYKVDFGATGGGRISLLAYSANLEGGVIHQGDGDYSKSGVSLSLVIGDERWCGILLSRANSFRIPGLADLNWKEDIFTMPNPELKPERSLTQTAEFFSEFEYWARIRASVEYQDSRYRDLINWRRSQGIKYKPVNISRSDYFGTIYSVAITSPRKIFGLIYSHQKIVSLNREQNQIYNGKTITFQPDHINRLTMTVSYAMFRLRFAVDDVGKRYYLEENTKWLHPYTVADLRIGLDWKMKSIRITTEAGIDNLTNAHYQLMEYQPMPPRCYNVNLSIII